MAMKRRKRLSDRKQFLLKKNNEYKESLLALEKKNRVLGLATVASGVAALAVLVYVRFQS